MASIRFAVNALQVSDFLGSRIQAGQRSLARQIRSTVYTSGFYNDKLALTDAITNTLTDTLNYTLTDTLTNTLKYILTHTLIYIPACRATIRCRASIWLPLFMQHPLLFSNFSKISISSLPPKKLNILLS